VLLIKRVDIRPRFVSVLLSMTTSVKSMRILYVLHSIAESLKAQSFAGKGIRVLLGDSFSNFIKLKCAARQGGVAIYFAVHIDDIM